MGIEKWYWVKNIRLCMCEWLCVSVWKNVSMTEWLRLQMNVYVRVNTYVCIDEYIYICINECFGVIECICKIYMCVYLGRNGSAYVCVYERICVCEKVYMCLERSSVHLFANEYVHGRTSRCVHAKGIFFKYLEKIVLCVY